MTKKLFVGGLSWGTKDEQLKAAFEKFGTVTDAKVILDQETGRSRGFGFVTITEDDGAERAIREMDGADVDGRAIRVNEAQERAPRDRQASHDSGGRSAGRGSGGRGGGYGGGGGGGGGGHGGGGGPSRSGFRNSDARPAASSRGGSKRRGRGGDSGGGDDRFARRRNSHEGRSSGRGRDDYDSDGYENDY